MRSAKINRLPIVVAALASFRTSAQPQVIYIVPGDQYPVAGERVIRLDIGKAIWRALTPPCHSTAPAKAVDVSASASHFTLTSTFMSNSSSTFPR